MSKSSRTLASPNDLLASYVVGFILSIVLTTVAYVAVSAELLSGWGLVCVIVALAVMQAVVQLTFFLDLGSERKPHMRSSVMACMLLIVVIVIGGSLWIMHSLNYRMDMHQMQQYMYEQDGL